MVTTWSDVRQEQLVDLLGAGQAGGGGQLGQQRHLGRPDEVAGTRDRIAVAEQGPDLVQVAPLEGEQTPDLGDRRVGRPPEHVVELGDLVQPSLLPPHEDQVEPVQLGPAPEAELVVDGPRPRRQRLHLVEPAAEERDRRLQPTGELPEGGVAERLAGPEGVVDVGLQPGRVPSASRRRARRACPAGSATTAPSRHRPGAESSASVRSCSSRSSMTWTWSNTCPISSRSASRRAIAIASAARAPTRSRCSSV